MSGDAWQTPPALPPAGIWSHAVSRLSGTDARAFAEEIDELRGGALWIPEPIGGREPLAFAAQLLSWTTSLVVATGIASIYARDAVAAASGARTLADVQPGRFVLGLGVSHAPQVTERGHAYARPLDAMAAYLDEMDASPYLPPLPDPHPPRVLAALNPRMLRAAAERCAGAHTYFMPVSHTQRARELLGPDATLAVEVGFVLGRDDEAIAEHVGGHVSRDNYRRALLFAGLGEEDVDGGGSRRLIDAVTVRGSVEDVFARVHEHLDAGATHVCLQALSRDRADPQLAALREVAAGVRELNATATARLEEVQS